MQKEEGTSPLFKLKPMSLEKQIQNDLPTLPAKITKLLSEDV